MPRLRPATIDTEPRARPGPTVVDASFAGAQARPSPALDLQRRLGDAALRGFFEAPATQGSGLARRRLTVALTSAAMCWSLVFGAGALLMQ